MALRVGAIEEEREQIIVALRKGKSYEEATAPFRKAVEADWFERNEKHLLDVAKNGEKKPSPVAEGAGVATKAGEKK